MATWGKGIANGFSFCALTGIKEVMEIGGINRPGAEKVFLISTTHGGETHAVAAGLETIKYFNEHDVVNKNKKTGRTIIEATRAEISKEGLSDYITVSDSDWTPIFVFKNREGATDMGIRTLFMQEMIQRGVLFQGAFTPSFSHNSEEIDFFIEAFSSSIGIYKGALEKGYENYLIGPSVKPVFRKYL